MSPPANFLMPVAVFDAPLAVLGLITAYAAAVALSTDIAHHVISMTSLSMPAASRLYQTTSPKKDTYCEHPPFDYSIVCKLPLLLGAT